MRCYYSDTFVLPLPEGHRLHVVRRENEPQIVPGGLGRFVKIA